MSKVDAAFISNVIEEHRKLSLRLYRAEQTVVRIRHIIADMKSNHGTHAEYIKRLEQTLDSFGNE